MARSKGRRALRKAAFSAKRASLPRMKRMAIMGTGLPQRVMVRHRYVQQINIVNSAPQGTSVFAISANGMFAPTITSGTPNPHQPMYFDQYAALYDHFIVIGSKITFTVANNTGAAAGAYSFCALLDDNSSLLSNDALEVSEQTQGRNLITMAGNENDAKKITLKYSAKKMFGGSILSKDELQGSATANPSENSVFALVISGAPGSGFNCYVTATVEYIAIWRELREVSQS